MHKFVLFSGSNTTNGDKMGNLRHDFLNFVAQLHTVPHPTRIFITPTQVMDSTRGPAGSTRRPLVLAESAFIGRFLSFT